MTDEYEAKCRRKVLGVIEAANLNSYHGDIRLETVGVDPSCRVTIPAYVLERLLKEPVKS
jgi:hypothetical protein